MGSGTPHHPSLIVVLMGVSGAGKTTIGKLLAQDLGWKFFEGDDFHPQMNVDKMRRGIPLNDEEFFRPDPRPKDWAIRHTFRYAK